jgi:hypothetical protein
MKVSEKEERETMSVSEKEGEGDDERFRKGRKGRR